VLKRSFSQTAPTFWALERIYRFDVRGPQRLPQKTLAGSLVDSTAETEIVIALHLQGFEGVAIFEF
jgi:hypothetical protein